MQYPGSRVLSSLCGPTLPIHKPLQEIIFLTGPLIDRFSVRYVLNYMARVAGSQARFSYDTDEGDYEEFEDTSSVASDEGALREEIHQVS